MNTIKRLFIEARVRYRQTSPAFFKRLRFYLLWLAGSDVLLALKMEAIITTARRVGIVLPQWMIDTPGYVAVACGFAALVTALPVEDPRVLNQKLHPDDRVH